MKYQNAELRQQLSGEYVLGTLHGKARLRFERLMRDDADLRRIVNEWQQKISPMTEAIADEKVPRHIWRGIEQRLGFGEVKTNWLQQVWQHLGLWRSISVASTAATLYLALYLIFVSSQPVVINQYVAVMTNSQQQASWLISTDLSTQKAVVKVLNKQDLPLQKAYQLWMLPQGKGQQPVSMGLLSATEDKTLILNKELIVRLIEEKALAVSLEPEGGSPTGLPTGPVLYQGKLQSI